MSDGPIARANKALFDYSKGLTSFERNILEKNPWFKAKYSWANHIQALEQLNGAQELQIPRRNRLAKLLNQGNE